MNKRRGASKSGAAARHERSAAALRANLGKRKELARAREKMAVSEATDRAASHAKAGGPTQPHADKKEEA